MSQDAQVLVNRKCRKFKLLLRAAAKSIGVWPGVRVGVDKCCDFVQRVQRKRAECGRRQRLRGCPSRWPGCGNPVDGATACRRIRARFRAWEWGMPCIPRPGPGRTATGGQAPRAASTPGAPRSSCSSAQRTPDVTSTSLQPAVRWRCESFPCWSRSNEWCACLTSETVRPLRDEARNDLLDQRRLAAPRPSRKSEDCASSLASAVRVETRGVASQRNGRLHGRGVEALNGRPIVTLPRRPHLSTIARSPYAAYSEDAAIAPHCTSLPNALPRP